MKNIGNHTNKNKYYKYTDNYFFTQKLSQTNLYNPLPQNPQPFSPNPRTFSAKTLNIFEQDL